MNVGQRFFDKKNRRWVRAFQLFFYVCFVILWFKDNFPPLKNLNISYLFALIPLLLLTALRTALRVREGKVIIPRRISRETAVLLALLFAAVVFRIPQLLYPSGMMNSDDAVAALMGKHIAEGKLPPICFYGQLYMGSLYSHYLALMFKIFGYSIFVLRCSTILVYLAFIALLFLFLKDVFSSSFALLSAFFLALPFPYLVIVSIDGTSAYALVLLLGTSILYLSYLVSFKARENWLAPLGFLMGIAFWTHQVTAGFILTAILVLLPRIRLSIKKYFQLAFYAFVGFLPQFLAEVFIRFRLFKFLRIGQKVFVQDKPKYSLRFVTSLLTSNENPWRYLFVILLLVGFLFLILRSRKRKDFRAGAIFSLFSLVFFLIYFLSFFSTWHEIRYLYPLYASLPVLLLAPFLPLKQKLRNSLALCLVIVLFFFFNFQESVMQVRQTKDGHFRIARLVKALRATQQAYWQAEFWTAYLLTAVSKEKPIIASFDIQRYLPYSLAYYNDNQRDNYVFSFIGNGAIDRDRYAHLSGWLEKFGIRARNDDVGNAHLVWDIKTQLGPKALGTGPPAQLPLLELDKISPSEGYLHLVFKNKPSSQDLRFWIKAEIPEFSSSEARFSLKDQSVQIELPLPATRSFTVCYYLEYQGVEIPVSFREVSYTRPAEETAERRERLVYLRGFGPEVEYLKKKQRICEKESAFELNGLAPADLNLRLFLTSPFDFSYLRWYGKYAQGLKIEVNGRLLGEKELHDGENELALKIPGDWLKGGGNIVTLKFRYHYWAPRLSPSLVAALLDKVEID
jgi:hypothetical protein